LLITAPGSDGNVRVVAAVNEGLVCLVNGKLLWSFQPALPSTSVGATVRVSAPALDDTDSDTIIYAFTDSSTSATTMRAVSLATGTLKWSQSFVLPLWMLSSVRTATAQQAAPVLSGGRAFLSVLGRALVVVDVASGTVVSDGTGLLSGSRVSVGVAPVLSPNSNALQPLRSTNGNSSTSKGADNPDLLVSVCTEALADPATGSPAAPPPNGRTFQLCVHTADGAALPVDGQYNLGCADAAGRFQGMSALAQPLLALGNRVSMFALQSDALELDDTSGSATSVVAAANWGCVVAVPDRSTGLSPWSFQFPSPTPDTDGSVPAALRIQATPVLLSARLAIGTVARVDKKTGTVLGQSLYLLQARDNNPRPAEPIVLQPPAASASIAFA